MSISTRVLFAALVSCLLTLPGMASAQDATHRALISIYHAAPGKQLDLLKWFAAREAADREAGVGPTQVYAHVDGDSWDYLAISPDIDQATSSRVDALVRKHGMTAGPKASLEFRTMILSHTDTYVVGPYTASELVDRYSRP